MPEQVTSSKQPQQPHAQTLRQQDALRRLSRSPHPYHHQQFELAHSSERFSTTEVLTQSSLRPSQRSDDEPDSSRTHADGYHESTNSDSGTEADDERFLKGLPAPKLRPHKGLRGRDGALSGSPSPRLSPTLLDGDSLRTPGFRRKTLPSIFQSDEEARKVAEMFRQRRRIEVIRRATEAALLVLLGGMICLEPKVRSLLRLWWRELASQLVVTLTLLALYPIRLLRNIHMSKPWKTPYPVGFPAIFDPAPLFYPPVMTLFVSSILSSNNTSKLLPSIILGISSLPRHLIPATGGLVGSNTTSWLISCIPLFIANSTLRTARPGNPWLTAEILVLLPPLHNALCVTLHCLTTTSLLEAELQLLSVALIHLLLLATSPQAVILKALLWGGGVGILVSCFHVLQWGVALARIPKWRFRRPPTNAHRGRGGLLRQGISALGTLVSIFSMGSPGNSRGDEYRDKPREDNRKSPKLKLTTRDAAYSVAIDGSVSAVDPKSSEAFMDGNEMGIMSENMSLGVQRRHTLPSLTHSPPRLMKTTSAGRKKRTMSSGANAFFAFTQQQATIRKWLYAAYVYSCVAIIVLVGIRKYVEKNALNGNEPVGWALGYLLGDISGFRMEVVYANLQRWVCLPSRNEFGQGSSDLGWVGNLRRSSFGEANTRLLLCGYWLGIIIVGLAVVFRLSAIYEVDTRRKVFHFMMVAMLLPATFVDPTFASLALSLMLAIFLLLDLFRASQLPPLSKSLAYFLTPYVDGRDLKGPVVISHIFLLIGCAIPLWLSLGSLARAGTGCFQGWEVLTRDVSMVSGVICVGMGDAAASLIGRRYGRHKWIWGGGKSIEGSVAFATAVALALIMAKGWLRIGGWPANNDDTMIATGVKAGVAACVASLTEAVLTGGNDNVVVPVVLWLAVKGLNI